MTIGERIKAAREQAGVTQVELGEKIGVSGVAIMRYEKNARQPRLEQLQRIALALGTTVSELVEPGYWSTVSKEEIDESWESNPPFYVKPELRVENAMKLMDKEGRCKVADYAEDILPRYRAGEAPAKGGRSTPAPTGGQSTTPPPDAPETPPEGE